jgi:tetratricopeptide (TPR) repeat protein
MKRIVIAAAMGAAFASFASAQSDDQARYEACLRGVEADPDMAYEEALAWRFEGGGWPARHCVARALIALGQEEEGAFRLQALAEAPDGGPTAMKVLYLAEAGEAWMSAGHPEEAHRVYGRALEMSPQSAPLWLGRARAAAGMGEWATVEASAAQAISQDPGNYEGWRARAEARLELGDLPAAESDMRRALELAQTDEEAVSVLLIRGRINEARRTGG